MHPGRLLQVVTLAAALSAPAAYADDCVDCHQKTTPGIVGDWDLSKHKDAGVGVALPVMETSIHPQATWRRP